MISNRTPEVAADPAHIAGRWSYRTGSSCEDAEGVGWVKFVWDGAAGHYEERGEVAWPYVTFKVEWWGTATPDPKTGTVANDVINILGSVVTSGWVPQDAGPTQMKIDWAQQNHCHGHGVATRL